MLGLLYDLGAGLASVVLSHHRGQSKNNKFLKSNQTEALNSIGKVMTFLEVSILVL
jgi:hypothetical protein